MASSRDRTAANNAGNDYYLPGRPPSWLRPSINTQPDFHSLNCSLDILFLIIQHIRRHPLHTDPTPDQTYFQDDRAYNILYQFRRDMMLMDRLVDSIYQARRLLQFVPGEPGLPGQYRIDPSARLSSSNLAALHSTPPGFPLPPTLSDHSPSPTPRTPLRTHNVFAITGLAFHHVTTTTSARATTTVPESAHAPETPTLTNPQTSQQQQA